MSERGSKKSSSPTMLVSADKSEDMSGSKTPHSKRSRSKSKIDYSSASKLAGRTTPSSPLRLRPRKKEEEEEKEPEPIPNTIKIDRPKVTCPLCEDSSSVKLLKTFDPETLNENDRWKQHIDNERSLRESNAKVERWLSDIEPSRVRLRKLIAPMRGPSEVEGYSLQRTAVGTKRSFQPHSNKTKKVGKKLCHTAVRPEDSDGEQLDQK